MSATPGTARAPEDGFQIARDFDAPRAQVFRAWTEAARLRRWLVPRHLSVIGVAIDLRPGGRCHYGLRATNGLETWGLWIFREIQPPARLVFVAAFADADGNAIRHPIAADWPLETLTTLAFTEQPGECSSLTLSAAPLAASAAERQAFREGQPSLVAGWTAALAALALDLHEHPRE